MMEITPFRVPEEGSKSSAAGGNRIVPDDEQKGGQPVLSDGFASSGSVKPPPSFSHAISAAAKSILQEHQAGPEVPPEIIWSFQAPAPCNHPPVRGPEGNIYVRASDESVFALDEKGNSLWQVKSEMTFGNPPSVDKDGNIYFIDKYGIIDGITFLSYDSKGEKRWEFRQKVDGGLGSFSPDGAPLTVVDESANSLVARFQNILYSFDLQSGKPNWTFMLDKYPYSGIGLFEKGPDGKYYVASDRDRAIHCIDPQSGREEKKIKSQNGGSFLGMAPGRDGAIYTVLHEWDSDKQGIAAQSPDGKALWFTKGEFVGTPIAGPDTIFVQKKERKGQYTIAGIDAATGAIKWSGPLPPAGEIEPILTPEGNLLVKVDVNETAKKTTAGKRKWSRAFAEDPVSKIYCIRPDGIVKWVMQPGFWIYTGLSLDEKNGVLYCADNGGGCMGLNLKKIDELVEKSLQLQDNSEKPVEIEIEDGFVNIGGTRLPIRSLQGRE